MVMPSAKQRGDREQHPFIDRQAVSHSACTKLFENLAALGVVAKLIEARTGRRQQHDVARPRMRRGIAHRRLKIIDDHGLGEIAQERRR